MSNHPHEAVPLHDSIDAMRWAKEFVRLMKTGGDPFDEGVMVGWFANAIEVGRRHPYPWANPDGTLKS